MKRVYGDGEEGSSVNKMAYARIAKTFPEILHYSEKSLKKHLPLFRMQGLEQVLADRAQMISFWAVRVCYVKNLESFPRGSQRDSEVFLWNLVKRDVDYEFVDAVVTEYITKLLSRDVKTNSRK